MVAGQLGGDDGNIRHLISNHMSAILADVNDELKRGYGTDALTRIHGGENET